ncbi:MAG: hypothetical protein V3T33_06450 [Myxococcota bacterium]
MFDAKVHEAMAPWVGDAAAAFDLARTALVSQGFEVLEESPSEF